MRPALGGAQAIQPARATVLCGLLSGAPGAATASVARLRVRAAALENLWRVCASRCSLPTPFLYRKMCCAVVDWMANPLG
jgi:hypothetical protein